MQPPTDHVAAARRESRLLIGIAVGLGCLVVLCLVAMGIAVLLAAIWTLQGSLGPGGSSLLPAATALVCL